MYVCVCLCVCARAEWYHSTLIYFHSIGISQIVIFPVSFRHILHNSKIGLSEERSKNFSKKIMIKVYKSLLIRL